MLLGQRVELTGQGWRRRPGVEALLLDRHDIRPMLQAGTEVVAHRLEEAGDRDNGDIRAGRLQYGAWFALDGDAQLDAEPGHISEVASELVGAVSDRPHKLGALLVQEPSHDRPHGADAEDDDADRRFPQATPPPTP